MESFQFPILAGALTRGIGKYPHFVILRLFRPKLRFATLSNRYRDEYKDMCHALSRDFLNALVGGVLLLPVVLVVAGICFA